MTLIQHTRYRPRVNPLQKVFMPAKASWTSRWICGRTAARLVPLVGIISTTTACGKEIGRPIWLVIQTVTSRSPLYPFVPVFFILMSMVIIWNAVSERPLEAGLGIATVLAGTPLYLLWRRLSIGSHS